MMNIFETNRYKYFLRVILTYSFLLFGITYLFSLAADKWLDIEMSYESYILSSLIFLIVILLSLFDKNTTIKINKSNIKRVSYFRTNDIKWKNVTDIKFNYVLRTLSISDNNNRIYIGSYFEHYEKILELIYKMIILHNKIELTPKYITKRFLKK